MIIRRADGVVWGSVIAVDGVVLLEPLGTEGQISIHGREDGTAILIDAGGGAKLLISIADNGASFVAEMDGERSRRTFQIAIGENKGNAS